MLVPLPASRRICRNCLVVSSDQLVGNPTLADAILDRFVHSAYRIELSGESLRKQRRAPSEA